MRNYFSEQLAEVTEKIVTICRTCGRDAGQVRIVAVTKTHPPEFARKACAAGVLDLGENRVQEASEKYGDGWLGREFPHGKLHLIGHLQSNKAKRAAELFDSIDSVDSVELAEKLDLACSRLGKRPRVLLQVNTSGEIQKSGCQPGEALKIAEKLLTLKSLDISGLMAIGPLDGDELAIRRSFAELRKLSDLIASRLAPSSWGVLSMGMSDDYEWALLEGATEIRLGSALFGPRE
ncbi:YggS family pyridoxal phosphate-dependent enzyme [bacterium]|nr:YggS family pyridoxal phosphate-dependent enzyme [bacterium]